METKFHSQPPVAENDGDVYNTSVMKKVTWIYQIFFAVIILFLAAGCKKEEITGDIEYKVTHWPIVKTLEATDITDTTATLNGTVITYGLATTVTFEYGTTASYGSIATACQIPATGDSITYVSVNISGLTPCTPYHFRVRAENSLWTNFLSSDLTFISGHIPTLTTSLSDTTAIAVIIEINITDEGCSPITDRGIISWIVLPSGRIGRPIPHPYKTIHEGTGTGSYTINLTGLHPSNTYLVQAFATNCAGTANGNRISFKTPSSGK
jgi:hypothetical protein